MERGNREGEMIIYIKDGILMAVYLKKGIVSLPQPYFMDKGDMREGSSYPYSFMVFCFRFTME